MITENVKLDDADRADFVQFRDYLRRIFGKYGPDVMAGAYAELLNESRVDATRSPKEIRCSFCGKPEVNRIIAGPGVFICFGCIDLCYMVKNLEVKSK